MMSPTTDGSFMDGPTGSEKTSHITETPDMRRVMEERIAAAVDIAFRHGQIEGGHHRAWVIDQMVRALLGSDYQEFVRKYEAAEDGESYEWGAGIPP